jgi:hypothetical protein
LRGFRETEIFGHRDEITKMMKFHEAAQYNGARETAIPFLYEYLFGMRNTSF